MFNLAWDGRPMASGQDAQARRQLRQDVDRKIGVLPRKRSGHNAVGVEVYARRVAGDRGLVLCNWYNARRLFVDALEHIEGALADLQDGMPEIGQTQTDDLTEFETVVRSANNVCHDLVKARVARLETAGCDKCTPQDLI